MSVSAEHIEEIKKEPAIVCCRTEAGTILSPANLEDPAIFDDLTESGLLKIPSDCLKVEEALGAELAVTIDSLTPVTPDMVKGGARSEEPTLLEPDKSAVLKYNMEAGDVIKATDLENPLNFEKLQDSNLIVFSDEVLTRKEAAGCKLNRHVPALTPVTGEMIAGYEGKKTVPAQAKVQVPGQVMRIKIAEGKGIDIEIPIGALSAACTSEPAEPAVYTNDKFVHPAEAIQQEPVPVRSLTKKHYAIKEVRFGSETKIEDHVLYIRNNICQDAKKGIELVKDIKIDIITQDKYNTYSETIMDVQPIATKEKESKLGSGATRVLDGVVMMVTGTDENGVQIGEFGSSEGILEENIMWNRPGAPDRGDIFIKTQVTIKAGTNMERPGPYAAHRATDHITQEIREAIKAMDEALFTDQEEIIQYKRPGKRKVIIVKEIMGQGAMHDNLILPVEPVGVLGGKPNVDLGNVPVMLSPLEVLDGGIHALTCIGPASKECSRHYWREPLIIEAMQDEDIDLCGVLFVGSPQINSEKFYVSERLGMTIEAIGPDGAIVTTEGFGNNHIDFASHIEQIGMRGIEVVGMSFCGVQGALVVGNKYMKHMVDNNKSDEGIENEVLACNTLCQEDAQRALEMLKSAMNKEEVRPPEKRWNPEVKEHNLDTIESAKGIKIERVLNEQSIPLSEKRKSKMGGNQ